MEDSAPTDPPLSPVLLAGIALGPVPPVLFQPFLDAAMAVMQRRHPDLFARLAGLSDSTFRIDPVDLPFDFLLRTAPPRLTAFGRDRRPEAVTATIQGPLVKLVQLLEGELDGDALFFSRDLIVEGDMEAVVTLRNAVDGAGIDVIADLLSALGPLGRPVGFAIDRSGAVLARLDRDLTLLKRALLAPVHERCRAQARELQALRATLAELRRNRGAGRGANARVTGA